MNEKLKRSQREFVVVTLVALIAIALIIAVYATLLGTFQGLDVTVGGVGGAEITYSLNNANDTGPWTTTLDVGSVGTPWYSRIEITSGDYSGPVTITWTVQQETSPGTWTPVVAHTDYTSVTLSGSTGQIIYVTSDGVFATGNYDWDLDITAAGTYRIVATINS